MSMIPPPPRTKSPEISTLEFFRTFYPAFNGQHHLEIRKLPGGKQTFCRSAEEAAIAADDSAQNVHFGVSMRDGKYGDEEHASLLPVVFADVDTRDFGGDRRAAAKAIADFQFEPSVMIDSGNGFHGYWLLKEPVEITEENRKHLKGILRGLAEKIGADVKCAELARILRVPGTFNLKDPENKKPAKIVCWHPERRYKIDDFEHYCIEGLTLETNVPLPAGEANGSRLCGKTKDFLAVGSKNGERNQRTYAATCDMKGCGYPLETARQMLLEGASRCQPPMDVEEAKKAIESAWKDDRSPARPQPETWSWGTPQDLPDFSSDVMPFDYDMLPESFQPWIRDIAERMQCPPDFPAVGAMVALSAVVGRQVTIRPKVLDDWAVVPNLWGGIIGRPSYMKSPALQEILKPLDRLETKAKEAYDEEMCDYEVEKLVTEGQVKHAKGEIRKALKAGKDPHESAKKAMAEEGASPIRRRYRTNDPTVEKLGELLNENPRGLLLFRDELTGFLKKLDREGHESDRAFYLESWNGTNNYVFDRIGRGTIDISATCISILGGIQPGPMSTYMARAARGGQDDDGLVQRFQLLVYPDPSGVWQNIDRSPDLDARNRAYDVFERLDNIDPISMGAQCDNSIPSLRFATEAQEQFTEWRTDLEHHLRGDDLPPILEAHLGKFRSLIPSLSLLIHLADSGCGNVSSESLLRACTWGEYLESHARRVYAPAIVPETLACVSLADHIKRGDLVDGFTAREVQRKGWADLQTRESVGEALVMLEELNWVRSVQVPTDGRTKVVYEVNPEIVNGGSDGQVGR